MALNKSIKAETLTNGKDLKLTDNSVYDVTTPKSLFDNRHITITFSDGTEVEKEFPYDNTNNSIVDSITYANVFSKDSIISIKVEFIYVNSGTATEELEFNYISNILNIKQRSKLANAICGCDDCNDEYSNINKIDVNLKSAEYAAQFKEIEKAQKFLDKATDISDSLNNKNCKDC